MGRYLAIADQALNEINVRSDANEKTNSPTHREISELGEISPDGNLENCKNPWPIGKCLRAVVEEDWDEISADKDQLEAARYSLRTIQQVAAGQVPESYTATTNCERCGPVPIWDGCPPEVLGCPWCFNRIQGLSMPNVKGQ